MIASMFYVLLAILGLSFLIFIHELGHYFMARRVGMKVDVFSIGFGKPIYSWIRDGVRWQVGWLLFGGYVKIADMDPSEKETKSFEKNLTEEGFHDKKPLDRIKVAFMGPFVNIVFAFLVFAILWGLGGREKNFAEYTHKIGWLDPKSELYQKGVRPGDEITSYNGQPYQSAKDHIYVPMTAGKEVEVKGNKINFMTKEKTPFNYTVKTYPHPAQVDKDILTAGVLQPANYIIYDRLPNGKENPLPEGSPMMDSGIKYGDRIVWVDGEPVFGMQEVSHLLNDSRSLLTIKRGQETLLRRVPRVHTGELRLDPEVKEELIDWQYEAQLNKMKIPNLYVIPYNLNNEGVVEGTVKFIDNDKEEEAFPKHPFSVMDMPLMEGDKIIAVDDMPVKHSYEILLHLQQRHVNIIVERNPEIKQVPSWRSADDLFDHQYSEKNLQTIVSHIGEPSKVKSSGNLVLLDPIVPRMRSDFKLSPEGQALFVAELQAYKKEIENIDDPEKKAQALHQFENWDKQLLLGLPAVHDQKVDFNPGPVNLFVRVFDEIWSTLKALFTGSLNPKWMTGPIGIVQVVHDNFMVSLKEALFWLGAISLNLGVLNLLPLPVLDGGSIVFAFYELLTGKRLKPKTIEKLIIPFAIILIGFFVFLTYNDLLRLLGGFFH